MNQPFFISQIERLKSRFGFKHFDPEFVRLVANEIHDMSEHGFKRTCDVFIGSRSVNKPPLLSEFREARLNEEKYKHQPKTGAESAISWLESRTPPEQRERLKLIFAQEFDGAETAAEALAVARRRIREANEKKHDDDNGPGAA